MSYEVLARKWRPQTFDEVIGQDHITRTLKKAVESERLAHAYIFSGPRGCGKTSTARILAKVINCTDAKKGNPCNKCASCTGVVSGNNLDVMEIDGASHTGVNEVRDLQESIGYAASQFKNKVYIIDEVHMLSTHAFNALLKTLEEPPSHVYFIFATTAARKIPDTIKSRCQRHQFKRLEIGEIVDHLDKIATSEKVKSEKDALRLLARKAEGSMRDAESLFDQCITASGGKVDTTAVRNILGMLDQTMVFEFLETIAKRDPTEVLRTLDKAIQQGVDLEELLNALIEGFRDVMLLAASKELSELIYRSKEEIKSIQALTSKYEIGDLVTVVERLCNVSPRLRMASEPRILLESALVDIALLERQVELRELIAKLEEGGPINMGGKTSRGAKPGGSKGSSANLSGAAQYRDDLEGDRFVETRPAGAMPQPANTAQPPQASGVAAVPDAPFAKPAQPATPGPSPKDADFASLDYASIRQMWDGFVTYIRQKKLSLGVCLISGTVKSMDEHTVLLRFAKGFSYQRQQVEHAANQKFLKGMMQKYFGRDLELVCFKEGEDVEAERSKQRVQDEVKADTKPKRSIENKPIVKKILTDFDGEIVQYHP